ncbi:alpha-D-ribose 1-methylphosphonate 5-triphosphate diphosphatase [Salinihabitans flavidus]|uniref:Alpha-D-ribose 1-methylphosphonate 5-triphosphate diphosphatase n=1 Tax=Salinihabitans flavidus TaxID=569882 RepID=A0A1H8VVB7_9RHOB|nr:alpha-D-ribose 1-methylphosphonate 5-triphosphate diphosphatase [Salinihabitans flavidus]
MDLRLSGEVLGAGGFVEGRVDLSGGRIVGAGGGRDVDLSGFWILPGLVDAHGDGFERHLAPRRGAMRDLGQGLMACDAELAASGITTAVLAQFFSWEGGMRGPDFAQRFLEALERTPMATAIFPQLRLETHLLDEYSRFAAVVAAHDVPYVVFNDHLPHTALAKGKRPPRLTGQALKSGRSPEAHLALLEEMFTRRGEVPGRVAALARDLRARGVHLGSHDDRDAAAREGWRAAGVSICEFPETRAAAEAAREGGDFIVLGAPNIVRGGSHSGNVAAADLVEAGLCDALASDYHYPAPVQAVFRLVEDGVCDFQAAWRLVSEGPARMLGLRDRGRIAPGLRADLVVIDPQTKRVGATFVAGRVSHMTGRVAERFMR